MSEPDSPEKKPSRGRKRIRVKVEKTPREKARSWWRRRRGIVLIVAWFLLASVVLAVLVLTGHLKAPTPPLPPSE